MAGILPIVLFAICLMTIVPGISAFPVGNQPPGYPPADWLSDDRGYVTYYGPYGYPIWTGFYDDRLYYDDWYPVARSFLDGTTYYRTYNWYVPGAHIDGNWWGDPRGYRPLYRIRPGIVLH